MLQYAIIFNFAFGFRFLIPYPHRRHDRSTILGAIQVSELAMRPSLVIVNTSSVTRR